MVQKAEQAAKKARTACDSMIVSPSSCQRSDQRTPAQGLLCGEKMRIKKAAEQAAKKEEWAAKKAEWAAKKVRTDCEGGGAPDSPPQDR